MPQIISLQSSVSYGFVGNSVACFALRRAGNEVWPVYTVNFSNHTGYPTTRGLIIPADEVAAIVDGLDERGALATTDALLSGYQGAAAVGRVICDTVDRIRAYHPDAIYCCDPVMGDVGRGFYTPEEIHTFIAEEAVPRATIMTPNHFELEYLVGRSLPSLADVVEGMRELRARGPRTVVTTSVVTDDATPNTLLMVAQNDQGTWRVETPMIPRTFTGSGDLTASMFLSSTLAEPDLGKALGHTASIVYSVLKATHDMGRDELAMVQCQDMLITPAHTFTAEAISHT